MRRVLVTFSLIAPLLMAGCGGGGGGGASPTDPGATIPAATTTPASSSFPAAAAYSSYAALARQQSFSLSPFGFCSGNATLTETAPAPATFEGGAAMRKTTTWVLRFTNCVPDSDTNVTEVFQDVNHAAIGQSRSGVGYAVLDRPLVLPASVKVGDAANLAIAPLYTDSAKTNQRGTIDYSFVAEADNRADSILVRLTARTTSSLGQQLSTEVKTYRITASGAMDLTSLTLNENGRRLIFTAE